MARPRGEFRELSMYRISDMKMNSYMIALVGFSLQTCTGCLHAKLKQKEEIIEKKDKWIKKLQLQLNQLAKKK